MSLSSSILAQFLIDKRKQLPSRTEFCKAVNCLLFYKPEYYTVKPIFLRFIIIILFTF